MKKKQIKKKSQPKGSLLELNISIGGASLSQKAFFAKNMSVMLKSGLTLTEALETAVDTTQGTLKKTMRGVLQSVRSGNPLHQAFAHYPKVFSGLFINAVKAGDSSGTLDESLANVSEQLEKEKELRSKVTGALLYPSVVMVAAFGLGIFLTFVVLPKITPLFEGLNVELPATTRGLIWFSNFIQANWLLTFIGTLALVAFLVWLVRQKFMRPVTHWLFLNIPIAKKITLAVNVARFNRTLGTLLKSGLTIERAIDISRETIDNYYYQAALQQVGKSISKGTKLSDQLQRYQHLFPIMVIRMIRVGEESGKLEETLLYLAHTYEREADASTKAISTAIEPILLLGIGLVVTFLALAIITPIYDITGRIRR